MWFLALVACSGGGAGGNLSASTYLPPWASHLMYESVDPAALEGAEDTAAPLAHVMHLGVSGTGDDWTWALSEGDNYATASPVMEFGISTADGLAITSVDGAALSPALVLLPATYAVEEPYSSGDYRATASHIDTLTTWYGVFEDVLGIEVSGPTVATFRMAEGIGPVQFAWGDVAGDLAWYE